MHAATHDSTNYTPPLDATLRFFVRCTSARARSARFTGCSLVVTNAFIEVVRSGRTTLVAEHCTHLIRPAWLWGKMGGLGNAQGCYHPHLATRAGLSTGIKNL